MSEQTGSNRSTASGTTRPHVLVILADDLGFSDIGCYGSEISTPHLDRLADQGVQMTQFYNTARCTPARASLLTGLHPHQTGIGVLVGDDRPLGYVGRLSEATATMAEVLRGAGYATLMAGKWHLTHSTDEPDGAWPLERGFDRFHGILCGSATYYHPYSMHRQDELVTDFDDDFHLTDDLGDAAARQISEHLATQPEVPFFQYLAFTAPHWPLHATEADIAAQEGKYDLGWDAVREERHARQKVMGIVAEDSVLSERDPHVPAWEDTADTDWQAKRMEVYAAQVAAMDRAIGSVLEVLESTGQLDNTIVMFLSDNGGCAEEMPWMWADENPRLQKSIPARTPEGARVRVGNDPRTVPGPRDTFASYGVPWANVSNTPFREYKHWVHEGGIATPMIVHWPAGLPAGTLDHTPHHLPDVMATVLEATGAAYPTVRDGHRVPPVEGQSMLADLRGEAVTGEQTLCFEHEGNAAIRRGQWKLVQKYGQGWELYDLSIDRTETTNLAHANPEVVLELAAAWREWADRVGVIDRAQVLAAQPRKASSFVTAGLRSVREK